MGTFTWPIRLTPMGGGRSLETEAMVDTGATYTTLPRRKLQELGIEPIARRRFLLADGKPVDMEVGQAWIEIDGESVVTVVAFGADNAPALLGAYTLEGLALAADPTSQRLVPTNLIMY
ncbi:aspartyl protease family protein [Candidatus Poriferisocius sp.]|uniref:aspartyl protease family protein n=1 Tax=Candidatus Poriferisocius sp. TaxID=3101276 RepID=UPI003B522DFB